MAKYKSNLIDKIENTNNIVKWIIIVISGILALLILFWGVIFSQSSIENNQPTNIILEVKNVISKSSDSIKVSENISSKPDKKASFKETKIKPKEKPDKKKNKTSSKPEVAKSSTEYKNSFQDFKIVGIVITKGNSSKAVYLKKANQTKKMNIGDKLLGYNLKEIHRTYILLNKGKKHIHLNYIN